MKSDIYHALIVNAPELLHAVQQNREAAVLILLFLAFLAWLKQNRK